MNNEPEKLDWKPIENSRQIKSVAYETKAKRLHIKFLNNSTYAYLEVPKEVYIEFAKAESAGKFFHAEIKNKFTNTKTRNGR